VSRLFDGDDRHGSKPVTDKVSGKMSAWDRKICSIYGITEAEWLERAMKTQRWLERFHGRNSPAELDQRPG